MRMGYARFEAILEDLRRELALGAGSAIVVDSLSLSDGGIAASTTRAASVTTATLSVTHTSGHTDAEFTQPAGTHIKELILISGGDITTGAHSNAELDFSLGTAAGGGQLLAAKAIIDGNNKTWSADTALYLIRDGVSTMTATGHFDANPIGGPDTIEVSSLVATTYSAAERTLHIRFTPIHTNLSAASTVKLIAVFQEQ